MQTRHSKAWTREIHTERWYCDLSHKDEEPKEFDSQKLLLNHLRADHAELTGSRLEGMALRNRRVATRDPLVCPLCDCVPDNLHGESPQQLARHIARHMESLSLLSLSYLGDIFDTDEKDDSSVSIVADGETLGSNEAQRTGVRMRRDEIDSFDDIPPTQESGNGARVVDGEELVGEPPLLLEPADWTRIPPAIKDTEELRTLRLSDSNPPKRDLLIVMLGMAGAGKTRFVSLCTHEWGEDSETEMVNGEFCLHVTSKQSNENQLWKLSKCPDSNGQESTFESLTQSALTARIVR